MGQRPSSVDETIRSTQPIERQVANHMDWAYLEGQSGGSAVDVMTRSGAGVELKFDWDSIRTGNHYLEFAQTSDNWAAPDRRDSPSASSRPTTGVSSTKHGSGCCAAMSRGLSPRTALFPSDDRDPFTD